VASALAGLALGFSLTVPPGPMNAPIASRSTRSLREGVLTGLGAMTADALWGGMVLAIRSEVDGGAYLR
jgi:threonine/homoserine/homoserine lactone efflux protein